MTIYVGNLAYTVTVEELKALFMVYGNVTSVKIIVDKQTGKSKGYGFVEMEREEEGEAAIRALSETQVKGRNLKVNNAHRKATSSSQE
jgi:RNA recognition motif-containing protein